MTSFAIPGLSIHFVRMNFAFPIFWSQILKGTVLFFLLVYDYSLENLFIFFSRIIPKHFVPFYSYVPLPFFSTSPNLIFYSPNFLFPFLALFFFSLLLSCPLFCLSISSLIFPLPSPFSLLFVLIFVVTLFMILVRCLIPSYS
uniref:Uncharacterized protein n=1 Tax=Cacopsylla melanoneura TaxID=428564 RepID=A0A8D8U0R0_9HEMI